MHMVCAGFCFVRTKNFILLKGTKVHLLLLYWHPFLVSFVSCITRTMASSSDSQAASGASSRPAGLPACFDKEILSSARVKIQAILKEINGGDEVEMDAECENFLLQYIVKFVEQVTTDSLQYARHRGTDTLEDQDVKFCLKEDHGIDTL